MTTSRRYLLITIIVATIATTGVYQGFQTARENQQLRKRTEAQAREIHGLQTARDSALKRLAAASAKLRGRLPVSAVPDPVSPAQSLEPAFASNLFGAFPGLKSKAPNKLTGEQIREYLKTNGRNAASLLAGYYTTGDVALLAEAIDKNPNNPQVALAAVLRKNESPEGQRRLLETFKQADPDNALPNYLSGFNYIQAGQLNQALQEFQEALGKRQIQDYSVERNQGNEQAFIAAGYSIAEARAIAPLQEMMYLADGDDQAVGGMFATSDSQLSFLQQVKGAAVSLKDLAKSYEQSGDHASAEAALLSAANLGRQFSDTCQKDGLSQMVGMASEVLALAGLDPKGPYNGEGQIVEDRISQLKQRRTAIRGLYQDAGPLLGTLSEQDWTSYAERARFFGEPAALQWVVGKYGRNR